MQKLSSKKYRIVQDRLFMSDYDKVFAGAGRTGKKSIRMIQMLIAAVKR